MNYKNSIGKEIPKKIGSYNCRFEKPNYEIKKQQKLNSFSNQSKLIDIDDMIEKSGLKDGMTISFHHHFRNGDKVVELVFKKIKEKNIKGLTLCASSLIDTHDFLIDYIKDGTIIKIETSGLRGELGKAISNGIMQEPVIIRSHGGRARAIMTGDSKIDIAFLGAPTSDEYGNATGHEGKNKCGSLGYAIVDSEYADTVVILTDNIVSYPNTPANLKGTNVDYVVCVDNIGDASGISTGATRITKNPRDLLLAKRTAEVVKQLDLLVPGFGMQTGSGGASIAVVKYIKQMMINENIKAQFALGGITSAMVDLYEAGFINKMLDTQSFDGVAIDSLGNNNDHFEISASNYANPLEKGAAVNKLDFVILSALEIDTDFNVNVITGSDGVLRGASGGHSDTAFGAKVTIIVSPLLRGRIKTVVDRINDVITLGEDVDVFVCEYGIAVNPKSKHLLDKLNEKGIKTITMKELADKATKIAGTAKSIEYDKDKIVAIIEDRWGKTQDVIYKIK